MSPPLSLGGAPVACLGGALESRARLVGVCADPRELAVLDNQVLVTVGLAFEEVLLECDKHTTHKGQTVREASQTAT